MADDDGTCGHCGGTVEHGRLTGNAGRWWGGGKLGWSSRPGRARDLFLQGESLVESMVGGVRVPATRCASCRLVWFRYPEG